MSQEKSISYNIVMNVDWKFYDFLRSIMDEIRIVDSVIQKLRILHENLLSEDKQLSNPIIFAADYKNFLQSLTFYFPVHIRKEFLENLKFPIVEKGGVNYLKIEVKYGTFFKFEGDLFNIALFSIITKDNKLQYTDNITKFSFVEKTELSGDVFLDFERDKNKTIYLSFWIDYPKSRFILNMEKEENENILKVIGEDITVSKNVDIHTFSFLQSAIVFHFIKNKIISNNLEKLVEYIKKTVENI